jgi:hypothetical protein
MPAMIWKRSFRNESYHGIPEVGPILISWNWRKGDVDEEFLQTNSSQNPYNLKYPIAQMFIIFIILYPLGSVYLDTVSEILSNIINSNDEILNNYLPAPRRTSTTWQPGRSRQTCLSLHNYNPNRIPALLQTHFK